MTNRFQSWVWLTSTIFIKFYPVLLNQIFQHKYYNVKMFEALGQFTSDLVHLKSLTSSELFAINLQFQNVCSCYKNFVEIWAFVVYLLEKTLNADLVLFCGGYTESMKSMNTYV